MPMGKHINEEKRAEILKLRAQGLTYKVIAIRTGLYWRTITKICLKAEKAARLADSS